jgi:hypothetical protein
VILVSSNYLGEGLLVASIDKQHLHPTPYVIRANQLLADTGWAQPGYHLHDATIDMVSEEVNSLRPGFLVLNENASRAPFPHDALLLDLIRKSPDFYRCIFTRTTPTAAGVERLEVYRAFEPTQTTPDLKRVYSHLQKTLARFLQLGK